MRFNHYAVPVFLVACVTCAAGDAKQDTKLLQGAWKITSAESSGTKIGTAKLGAEQIVFADDRVILKNQGKDVAVYTFSLKPSTKPKQMDWRDAKGREMVPLIYEVSGEVLKLCRPAPSSADGMGRRPAAFETQGLAVLLLTCRREKQ
jgi:uncharacterized protein (TIGR03067 family)